jgi:hypothetical protein
MLRGFKVTGCVSAARARELLDDGDWRLYGLVEDRGRARGVIRHHACSEVMIVEPTDDPTVPDLFAGT